MQIQDERQQQALRVLKEALQEATASGLFDNISGASMHPDMINQFCDGIHEHEALVPPYAAPQPCYLPQAFAIKELLVQCATVMRYLPTPAGEALSKAMKEFEVSGTTIMWSAEDVDDQNECGLTQGERESVIWEFIRRMECRESDWAALDCEIDSVLQRRAVCIKVEYDPLYTGGEYEGQAQESFVPLRLVDSIGKESGYKDAVSLAFTKLTKFDAMHITAFTLDTLYNQEGEELTQFGHEEASSAVEMAEPILKIIARLSETQATVL